MSSELYLEKMRSASMVHNPYYEYFRDSVGKGDNRYYSGIGDIYSTVPEFQQGYGVLTRGGVYPYRTQLGYGWGTWITNLFRFAKPLLKRGVKEVADLTSKVANDAIQGRNFKDSLKKHVSTRASELIEQAPEAFTGLIRKKSGNGMKARSSHSVAQAATSTKRRVVISRKKKNVKEKKKKNFPALDLIG